MAGVTTQVSVPLPAAPAIPYNIVIATGTLRNEAALLPWLSHISKALVVTDDIVSKLYLKDMMRTLRSLGIEAGCVVLPDGEQFKDMHAVTKVIDAAVSEKLDRKSSIIALGGGVIGDIAGFAAAVYHRGIEVIQVPTTLMAMVDSAVGGKTGVNHPVGGKNAIGAFHQPSLVLVDLERVVRRESDAVRALIQRCCAAKAAIVCADVKEGDSGLRAMLNLGHTFAHAIETGLGYGVLLHGEAVAVGLVIAAQLSASLGYVHPDLVCRVERLLRRANLPISLQGSRSWQNCGGGIGGKETDLSVDTFLDLMTRYGTLACVWRRCR
jgi:3-dehydroquinate synthase